MSCTMKERCEMETHSKTDGSGATEPSQDKSVMSFTLDEEVAAYAEKLRESFAGDCDAMIRALLDNFSRYAEPFQALSEAYLRFRMAQRGIRGGPECPEIQDIDSEQLHFLLELYRFVRVCNGRRRVRGV